MAVSRVANRPGAAVVCALLWTVAGWPPDARAGPPADPAALAAADSLLTLCTSMANGNADVIRQQRALLEQGRSPQELAQVRNSDGYQSAYQSTADTLGKVDEQELKKVCAVRDQVKP
jgi:hypothetical protein